MLGFLLDQANLHFIGGLSVNNWGCLEPLHLGGKSAGVRLFIIGLDVLAAGRVVGAWACLGGQHIKL